MEKTIVDFSRLPAEVLEEYSIGVYESYEDVFLWTFLDDDTTSKRDIADILKEDSMKEVVESQPYIYKCGDKYYRWTEAEYMYELAEKYPDAVEGAINRDALTYKEQAALFIKENPGVAREISSLLDKSSQREDILGKLKDRDLENLTDEEVDGLVADFDHALSNNESYLDAYWMTADYVIDDFVAKQNVKKDFSIRKAVPPTLDELVREYEHFIEATKDIRTVAQARAFEEQYHVEVEINGVSIDDYVNGNCHFNEGITNENIDWIRYDCFGHLCYIYDHFNGEPTFDIYYGPYGESCLAENIHIDDLKENYSKWIEDEILGLVNRERDNVGYTVPGGKHHIFIYVDNGAEGPFYVVEPNRVVDGAMEPMGDTTAADFGNFDELRKGIQWCFEQFAEDKEVSLNAVLANAKDRVVENTPGIAGKAEIEMG